MDPTEEAKKAIDKMFRDTNVPQSETDNNLLDIIAHCDELRATLADE